jgi:aryl-alcohol dehydrogenase-like predicted oxidoreductase
MEYTSLGRSALRVSRVCLGTMNFGRLTSEAEAFRIMDRALERGVNFFDTANGYAGGESERIIGRWFAQGDGRRQKVVLATKVYGRTSDWPNDGGLSARHIRQACEDSLTRLQTDHIDLYQMHHIDRTAPWEEIWQDMERLVTDGKVIYVGSSNFAGWHIAQANESARRRSFLGLVSEQSLYNLTRREVEFEVLPACDNYGLGFIRGRRSPVGPWLEQSERPARDAARSWPKTRGRRQPRAHGGSTSATRASVSGSPPMRRCAPSLAGSRRTSRWHGCARSRS